MTAGCLYDTARDFLSRPPPDDGLAAVALFKQFYSYLEQLKETAIIKKQGARFTAFRCTRRLVGADFDHVAQQYQHIRPLKASLNEDNVHWVKILRPNSEKHNPLRIVTLFCSGLQPQPLGFRDVRDVCSHWRSIPRMDYLAIRADCLRVLIEHQKEDRPMMSPKHYWVGSEVTSCPGGPHNEYCNILNWTSRHKPKGKGLDSVLKDYPDGVFVFGKVLP